MSTFYILAPPYQPCSGGVVALHKLAHNIAAHGERAVLVSGQKNSEWLGEIQSPKAPCEESGIAIYPEIVTGNPLGLKRVVRWLLNTPAVLGGDGKFEATDLVYKYADYFQAPDESKVKGILTAFDLQLGKFIDKGERRSGTCYMVRKGKVSSNPIGLCIDDYLYKGGHEYLAEVFNSHDTFISYDNANFCSVFATLCGCRSIVVPDATNRDEWKEKFPYFRYGIEYGEDDIDGAATTGLVRRHLAWLQELSLYQTKKFIIDCQMAFSDYPFIDA